MKTEAYFLQHCEEENCDLGEFQYTCPHCNAVIDDYDIWYNQSSILNGVSYNFNCKKCGKLLSVEWNKKEYKYLVHYL